MTKLNWGLSGQRFLEAGVDRGVLYPRGVVGVPWNGLISVNESPEGGAPKPLYLDGIKFLNISSAEEFKFSIEAYAAPREFALCDGTNMVAAGFFIANQPRKAFDFSYRTLIGNDIDGMDHGYKLHLVYNALAGPSERTNESIRDQAAPVKYKWDVTTTPNHIPGIKPTAHLVIDTRRVDRVALGYLEGILYGAEGFDPRMPDPDEVLAILGIPNTGASFAVNLLGYATSGVETKANLQKNPSFERSTGINGVRYNHVKNSSAKDNIVGWSTNANNSTIEHVSDDARPGSPTMGCAKGVTTVQQHFNIQRWTGSTDVLIPVVAGETWTSSGWVKVSHSIGVSATIRWRDVNNLQVSQSAATSVAVEPNEWYRVSSTAEVPAGAVWAHVSFNLTTGLGLPAGGYFLVDDALFEKTNILLDYFDGNSPDEDDFWYDFMSTPDNSTSIKKAYNVAGVNQNRVVNTRSSFWSKSGGFSLRQTPNSFSSTDNYSEPFGSGTDLKALLIPGQCYTLVATCYLPEALSGILGDTGNGSRSLFVHLNGIGLVGQSLSGAKAPNLPGEYELRASFQTPAVLTGYNTIRLYHGGQNGAGDLWWDNVALIPIPSLSEPYLGPAFNPEWAVTYENQLVTATWDGEEHNSQSTLEWYTLLETPGNTGDAYILDGNIWVFTPDGYWQNYGPEPVLP